VTEESERPPFDFTEDGAGIQRLILDGHLPAEPPEHLLHFGSTWEQIFPAIRAEIDAKGYFTLPPGPITDADVEMLYEAFRDAPDSEEHRRMFASWDMGDSWEQIRTSMLDRDKWPRDVEDRIRILRRQVAEGVLPSEPPGNFHALGRSWEEVFQTMREKNLGLMLIQESPVEPES
jgi:hypothetical protein